MRRDRGKIVYRSRMIESFPYLWEFPLSLIFFRAWLYVNICTRVYARDGCTRLCMCVRMLCKLKEAYCGRTKSAYVLTHAMDEKKIREHCACMCENAGKTMRQESIRVSPIYFAIVPFRVWKSLVISREVEEIVFCNFYDGPFVPEFLANSGATIVEG